MNKLEKKDRYSRRLFLSRLSVASVGTAFIGALPVAGHAIGTKSMKQVDKDGVKEKPNSLIDGVQIGVITYSYRSMEDQSIGGMLKDVLGSGISAIELMGEAAEEFAGSPKVSIDRRSLFGLMRKESNGELSDDEKIELKGLRAKMEEHNKAMAEWRATVPMDKFIEIKRMFNRAGISIYAWKPNTFGPNNTDAEIHYAFRVASVLGAGACTAEFPRGDDASRQTKRFGELAGQHGIKIAYHAHTQATPSLWDEALQQSKWNAINLDLGHWIAGGNPDPIPFIKKNHERIESMHLKDRTTPSNGAKNLSWGQGDTPIGQVLQLMRDEKYTFPASVELEYQIPNGSDAVKEVAKCLSYCRKMLSEG